MLSIENEEKSMKFSPFGFYFKQCFLVAHLKLCSIKYSDLFIYLTLVIYTDILYKFD